MDNNLLSYALLVVTSFFTLINPIGVMPVFLGVTSELSNKQKIRVARKSIILGTVLILMFAFSGQFLFKLFNISVDSLKIVGGAIFFVMGFDMLNARLSPIKGTKEEIADAVNNVAITPLAIPMLCGPGSITNAIVLMQDATTLTHKIIFIVGMLLVMLLSYIIFIFSSKIVKYIGKSGINIFLRLMSMIVMMIAVEFFLSGIKPLLEEILK